MNLNKNNYVTKTNLRKADDKITFRSSSQLIDTFMAQLCHGSFWSLASQGILHQTFARRKLRKFYIPIIVIM